LSVDAVDRSPLVEYERIATVQGSSAGRANKTKAGYRIGWPRPTGRGPFGAEARIRILRSLSELKLENRHAAGHGGRDQFLEVCRGGARVKQALAQKCDESLELTVGQLDWLNQ
jgi:hypothetical protein